MDCSLTQPMKINLTIDLDNYIDGTMQIICVVRPAWNKGNIKIKTFTDGISNKVLGFTHKEDKSDIVIIRINGNMTDIFTDRQAEVESLEILQHAGIGPMLYCIFNNGLCYEYIHGETLSREELRKPEIYNLITKEMVKMHKIPAKSESNELTAIFQMCEKFLNLIFSDQSPPGNKLDKYDGMDEKKLREEFHTLKEHLIQLKSPIVFCHNDLLVNNIVFNKQNHSIHFIDFELAGMNFQAFDIADHFCEFAGVDNMDYSFYPERNLQLDWIKNYLKYWFEGKGALPTDKDVERLYVQANKFALFVNFLWGVWGLVQAKYSAIDFDYFRYTELRFAEYFKRKEEFFALEMP